jgi:hypothetical protein
MAEKVPFAGNAFARAIYALINPQECSKSVKNTGSRAMDTA